MFLGTGSAKLRVDSTRRMVCVRRTDKLKRLSEGRRPAHSSPHTCLVSAVANPPPLRDLPACELDLNNGRNQSDISCPVTYLIRVNIKQQLLFYLTIS